MCSSCVPASGFRSPMCVSAAKDSQEMELLVPGMSIFMPLPCFCQKDFLPLKSFISGSRTCLLALSFLLFHEHLIHSLSRMPNIFKVCPFGLLR